MGWDVMMGVAICFHFCLNSLGFYKQGSSSFLLKVPLVVHRGEEFMWNVAAMGTWVPPGPGTRVVRVFVPHTHTSLGP